jgi:hypothetical protein
MMTDTIAMRNPPGKVVFLKNDTILTIKRNVSFERMFVNHSLFKKDQNSVNK